MYMEELKKRESGEANDKEILFTQAIKAGKRIYYLDVKRNRKEELFLAITESKKTVIGEGDDSQVNFEKHKIFLYKEDFNKFMTGLEQAIRFIQQKEESTLLPQAGLTPEIEPLLPSDTSTLEMDSLGGKINIDIDFE